jgi:hypothetical protein
MVCQHNRATACPAGCHAAADTWAATDDDDSDGVQYDTFHDGPPVCGCGRRADYDGRKCCQCAPW